MRANNVDTVASSLENEEVLEALILYLNTCDIKNTDNFYFMVNLLSDIIGKNEKVASNIAELEELKDETLSFNNLKEKSKQLTSLLMPNDMFFKLLVAHKEWLKATF